MTKKDLTGKRFGRLIVIKEAGRSKYGLVLWECKCECGSTKVVYGTNLTQGLTKSCGCFRTEMTIKRSTTHGKFHTFAYKTWGDMIQRCTNPKNDSYEYYGGRGVAVCERWLKFENFYEDMGDKLSRDLSIERIDNSKGYNPENCIWADQFTQARNHRINKNNKTGVKGVCWAKHVQKYQGAITVNYKHIHLGYFDTLEQAAQARKAGELKYWGDAR